MPQKWASYGVRTHIKVEAKWAAWDHSKTRLRLEFQSLPGTHMAIVVAHMLVHNGDGKGPMSYLVVVGDTEGKPP